MCYSDLTLERFQKIEKLVDSALNASNKSDASRSINAIRFETAHLLPPMCNIASELISAINAAAGRVEDKQFKIRYVNSKLYELRGFLSSGENKTTSECKC